MINFNGVDLVFGCRRVASECEGFSLELFWNYTSVCVWKRF